MANKKIEKSKKLKTLIFWLQCIFLYTILMEKGAIVYDKILYKQYTGSQKSGYSLLYFDYAFQMF